MRHHTSIITLILSDYFDSWRRTDRLRNEREGHPPVHGMLGSMRGGREAWLRGWATVPPEEEVIPRRCLLRCEGKESLLGGLYGTTKTHYLDT